MNFSLLSFIFACILSPITICSFVFAIYTWYKRGQEERQRITELIEAIDRLTEIKEEFVERLRDVGIREVLVASRERLLEDRQRLLEDRLRLHL